MFILTRLAWALPFVRVAVRIIAPVLFEYGAFIFKTAQEIEETNGDLPGKAKFNLLWVTLKKKVVADFEAGKVGKEFLALVDPDDDGEANHVVRQGINFVVAMAKVLMRDV